MSQTEIVKMRTPHSKTFALGDNQFMKSIRQSPWHYRSDKGELQDVDLSYKISRGDYLIDKAPFALRVKPNRPAYRYTGGPGSVSGELTSINDKPVEQYSCHHEKQNFIWKNIALDTDYSIEPNISGVATYLTLYSECAPKKWTWEVLGDTQILQPFVGYDAKGQKCELKITRQGDLIDVEWTGRVISQSDLRKAGKSVWSSDPVYPVKIDPTINEAIVAGADDVYSRNYVYATNFSPGFTFIVAGHNGVSGAPRWTGFRFQSIGIPQGAVIVSSVLTLDLLHVQGSPQVKIYGDDVDNAPAWSTGSRVRNITKTTAALTLSPTVNGAYTVDTKAIVQEIINRPGWVSNNNIRFGMFDQVGAYSNYMFIAALEHPTRTEAQLDITYALGSTFVPRCMMF